MSGCFPNIRKEMEKMEKMLKEKPDEKLIDGYNRAMKTYDRTGDEQHKRAADMIKKEIKRRKLKVE